MTSHFLVQIMGQLARFYKSTPATDILKSNLRRYLFSYVVFHPPFCLLALHLFIHFILHFMSFLLDIIFHLLTVICK